MKQTILGAACASLFIVTGSVANAALLERLGGLAYYDDVADLTWLADANYAQTTGYDADGFMDWATANAWAASLNINGVSGWRLPDTVQPDASCWIQSPFGYGSGVDCTGSELGNLFYNVLGGDSGAPIWITHNANYDLFTNINSMNYFFWSATDASFDAWYGAWYFNMFEGYQGTTEGTNTMNVWAVHSGDVGASVVPAPAAVWLFCSGLFGLVGVSCQRRRSQP